MSQPIATVSPAVAAAWAQTVKQPAATVAAAAAVATQAIAGLRQSTVTAPDRFVVLAGNAFTGKSTAAASFPNPLFLDLENKLPLPNIPSIPFHDIQFVDSIVRRANPANPPNTQDALKTWVDQNKHLLREHTVILDSLSSAENAFHMQTENVMGIKANLGGGQLFGQKLRYFNDLLSILAMFAGRVIVICHLCPVFTKDEKTGADVATGKYKPAITGSFAEKLPAFATTMAFCTRRNELNKPTSYWWTLTKCAAFDAGTLATKLPPSGEIDVTTNAYEAFKRIF